MGCDACPPEPPSPRSPVSLLSPSNAALADGDIDFPMLEFFSPELPLPSRTPPFFPPQPRANAGPSKLGS